MKAENVEIIFNSTVEAIEAEQKINAVKIKNVVNDNSYSLPVDGVFVSIGRKPATELFRGQVELDSSGYVIADESTKTNVDGVFAIGDVRTKALRQVVTAVADGALAAHFGEEYISISDRD